MVIVSTSVLILAAIVAFLLGMVLALAAVALKLDSLDLGWMEEEEKA